MFLEKLHRNCYQLRACSQRILNRLVLIVGLILLTLSMNLFCTDEDDVEDEDLVRIADRERELVVHEEQRQHTEPNRRFRSPKENTVEGDGAGGQRKQLSRHKRRSG